MAAVVIWSIYGFVSKQYMSGVTDYFAGFKNLDIFLLLYLFYQMPIWVFIVLFFDKELFVLLYSVCLEERKYN